MKKIRQNAGKKLRGKKGFSFSELLVCLLIMGLCGGLVTETLGLGIRHFRERTRDSDAQMLCNTLAASIQQELACASQVAPAAGSARTLSRFSTGADELDVTVTADTGLSRAIWCEFVSVPVQYDADGNRTVSAGGTTGGAAEIVIRYHVQVKDEEELIEYPLASYYSHGSTGRFSRPFSSDCQITFDTSDENGSFFVERFHVVVRVLYNGTEAASRKFVVTPVMKVKVEDFTF